MNVDLKSKTDDILSCLSALDRLECHFSDPMSSDFYTRQRFLTDIADLKQLINSMCDFTIITGITEL